MIQNPPFCTFSFDLKVHSGFTLSFHSIYALLTRWSTSFNVFLSCFQYIGKFGFFLELIPLCLHEIWYEHISFSHHHELWDYMAACVGSILIIAWNSIILDLSCRELNYCLEDDPKKKKCKDFVFLGYPNTSLTKTILRLYCCIIAMPLTIWYIPLLMLLCKSVQKALF